MDTRALALIALFATATFAQAEDLSPLFGSADQEPVQVAVDPATGLPVVAELKQPQPVVAARE
jgi:hypothetical protein